MTSNQKLATYCRPYRNTQTWYLHLRWYLDWTNPRKVFRAFYFQFVTPEVHRNSLNQLSILIHTAGWAAAPVMMQNLGTLKNLGRHTQQRLATALEAMKYKFQGFKAREYAMRSVVIARIAYTGQGGNLNELQLQKLDSITLHHARKEF
jgi:hypothetical protein